MAVDLDTDSRRARPDAVQHHQVAGVGRIDGHQAAPALAEADDEGRVTGYVDVVDLRVAEGQCVQEDRLCGVGHIVSLDPTGVGGDEEDVVNPGAGQGRPR